MDVFESTKSLNLICMPFFDVYGSFPVPPFDFFGNLINENLFKMTFHVMNCLKTCHREQVKKLSQHFLHAKCRVNKF